MARIIARFCLAAIFVAVAGFAAGCAEKQSGPTVKNIEQYPDAFYGERVTISGEVDEIYNQRAFALESGGGFFASMFDKEVLVVSKDKIALPENHAITKNLKLRITGVVRQYEVGKMDKELGWRPPGEIEVKFRDKPVIIVEKVVMKDKPEIAWTAPR